MSRLKSIGHRGIRLCKPRYHNGGPQPLSGSVRFEDLRFGSSSSLPLQHFTVSASP
jgi:hypothetical protein